MATEEELQEVLEALLDLFQSVGDYDDIAGREKAMEDARQVLIKYEIIKVYEEEEDE